MGLRDSTPYMHVELLNGLHRAEETALGGTMKELSRETSSAKTIKMAEL